MSQPYSKERFIKEAVEELHEVKVKWKQIGIQLEIPQSTLETIQQKCKDDPEEAFLQMINEWLKQITEPSWSDIVEALKSRSVGKNIKLAEKIRRRKCKDSSPQGMVYL